jgi:hypothetical protein
MFATRYWLIAAAVALVLGGCGLHDYQKRMAYEQDRLKYEEKENELLGPPVSFAQRQEVKRPEKVDKTGDKKKKKKSSDDEGPSTPKLFLRLPATIKPQPGREVWAEALLFRFPALRPRDPGLQEVCIAQGPNDKKFRPAVLKEVHQKYDTPEFKLKQARMEPAPLGGPTLRFDTYTTTDPRTTDNRDPLPHTYTVYFHTSRESVVAIVLRQAGKKELSDEGRSEEALKYSLATLALGPDMAGAKKRYRGP